jgi:hypothetical protein
VGESRVSVHTAAGWSSEHTYGPGHVARVAGDTLPSGYPTNFGEFTAQDFAPPTRNGVRRGPVPLVLRGHCARRHPGRCRHPGTGHARPDAGGRYGDDGPVAPAQGRARRSLLSRIEITIWAFHRIGTTPARPSCRCSRPAPSA